MQAAMRWLCAIGILALFSLAVRGSAFAQDAQDRTALCDITISVHRDIIIVGLPCPESADVSIVPTSVGVSRIIEALDILYAESPNTFAVIDDLKRAGPVVISYYPYPTAYDALASSTIALFIPSMYQEMLTEKTPKMFPALVTRDGIKWSARELAPVLGHELMGHGKQHLEDRMDAMRSLDMECEAWLLHEQVYQDLKFDKQSQDMVDFRQQLERLQCDDFIRYMRKRLPDQATIWDARNPDVPKLLSIFKGYIEEQKKMGMIDSADAASRRLFDEAIKRAEKSGDPEALYGVGLYYLVVGKFHDTAVAATWLEKAARKGHAGAQTKLAELLQKGNGLIQDLPLAVRLYTAAARQGDPLALYALGVLYETGQGVEKNRERAGQLFVKASQSLDTRPLVAFGILNARGLGFAQDYQRAHELFLRAARLGDPYARYQLGVLYDQGHGVKQNAGTAAKWFQLAANLNFPLALNDLADMYREGRGVPKDPDLSFKLYNKAAERGLVIAIANVGRMYQLGLGVEKNFTKAAEWYRKAADLGSASAQYALGLLYEKGWGVSLDKTQARDWYQKAKSNGFAEADTKLAELGS